MELEITYKKQHLSIFRCHLSPWSIPQDPSVRSDSSTPKLVMLLGSQVLDSALDVCLQDIRSTDVKTLFSFLRRISIL